jgi:RNA polymerase sigma-70 factor (ECF subfamily)
VVTQVLLPSPSPIDPAERDDASCQVEQTSDCDPRAARFRSLVETHFDFIWRSLRGLGVPPGSVDDAAQRVFLIASRKLDDINAGSERAFLFRTSMGVAANVRRTVARRREVFDEATLDAIVDEAPDAERTVELRERRALLDRVLAGMNEDLRTVFVLFVLEGVSGPEIAQLLGISEGTVASRLRRAREAFHKLSKRAQARMAGPGRTP